MAVLWPFSARLDFVEAAMKLLCNKRDYRAGSILALGKKHLHTHGEVTSREGIARLLIHAVSLPRIHVRALFERFLQGLPFDRLLHLLDLVLPQMTPHLESCLDIRVMKIRFCILRIEPLISGGNCC